ncbi:DJ-1/PfpI family protein [Aquimarina longa]|uniref:DJ-1/PfpI family protein n=1 Tax=Aquimarina longa TaxID=1080221 RepID=UPI000782291F|nr:DJ-1/PfpI family protein [Aquimarina longa]
MKKTVPFILLAITALSCSNTSKTKNNINLTEENSTVQEIPVKKKSMDKTIDKNLPTIGILIFEGVIINEVVAPLDVFANSNKEGKTLFNVITIAKENKTYSSAHGLKITPDFLFDETPKLSVLVIPSSYNPENQTADKTLIDFITEQNKTTDYTASHCAGAFLIGESRIAENKNIVTYVTGGEALKTAYPNLKVADDTEVSVIEDGKFISSNGSLVSYIASLDLLEKMTSKEHRIYVEESILLNRLQ